MEFKLQTINREFILDNPHGLNITYELLEAAAEGRCVSQIDVTEEEAGDIQTVVVLDQPLLALKIEGRHKNGGGLWKLVTIVSQQPVKRQGRHFYNHKKLSSANNLNKKSGFSLKASRKKHSPENPLILAW